jgi:molybdopterin synthase sulfur carrier subunit
MSIKLLYFAWVREKTGIAEERVDVPDGVETVSDLIGWLKGRGPEFESAFEKAHVIRAAVDQTHVGHDAPVANAREIAFFPPVTGG